MSCNVCRILRKGCSDDCMLRQCLQWIDNPHWQANAILFVAKFFGRACLMSFVSSAPINQRPSLFQSLLYEAVGRTVNPVSGAMRLLGTGNWHVCQKAAMTVLCGRAIQPLPEYQDRSLGVKLDNISECDSIRPLLKTTSLLKRKRSNYNSETNIDLCLFPAKEKWRSATPSDTSETTTFGNGSDETNRSLHGGEESS